MKHLKTYENFDSSGKMNREDMIAHLCNNYDFERSECDAMDNDELEMICRETPMEMVKEAKEKWIAGAIKHPGALKKQLRKKELSKGDVAREISNLKKKDKEPNEPGIQGLNKKDLQKFRRLNLTKTLMDLPKKSKK